MEEQTTRPIDTALHRAIRFHDYDDVPALLQQGADPNAQDFKSSKRADRPLHTSVVNNDMRSTLHLIHAGADVNGQRDDGETPLHEAAICGFTEPLHSLLRFGANPCIADDEGKTPLFHGMSRWNRSVYNTLLRAGALADELEKNPRAANSLLRSLTEDKYTHMQPVLAELGESIVPAPLPENFDKAALLDVQQGEGGCNPRNIGFWRNFSQIAEGLAAMGTPFTAADLHLPEQGGNAHLLDYASHFFKEGEAVQVLAQHDIRLTPRDVVDTDGKARPYVQALQEAGALSRLFEPVVWQGLPRTAMQDCYRALCRSLGADVVKAQLPNYHQLLTHTELGNQPGRGR